MAAAKSQVPFAVPQELESNWEADDDGNLLDDETYTFSYDRANHLVKVVRQSDSKTIGQYTYDALGRRVKKVVSDVNDTLDGTTLYYYDGLRVVERGRLDGSNNYVASHQHLWGLYLDEQLIYDHDADGDANFDAIGQQGGDKRYYVAHDFLYSAAAVIDASGNVLERYDYEPYGKPTLWSGDYSDTQPLTTGTCSFLFTGQMYDPETGLHHYKTRGQDPVLGRFIGRDSYGYADGGSLYQYTKSAPFRYTDVIGGDCGDCFPPSDPDRNFQHVRIVAMVATAPDWDKENEEDIFGMIHHLAWAHALYNALSFIPHASKVATEPIRFFITKTMLEHALEHGVPGFGGFSPSAFQAEAAARLVFIRWNAHNLGCAFTVYVKVKYNKCETCCPWYNPLLWGGEQQYMLREYEEWIDCTRRRLFAKPGPPVYMSDLDAKKDLPLCLEEIRRTYKADALEVVADD